MATLEFLESPAIGGLLARAALTSAGRSGGPLPDRVAHLAALPQDVGRLAAYDRVCGFTLRDRVPATWLHVLTFGLQTALMVERDFPYALAGLVHARNAMTLLRPVTVADELDLLVRAGNARAHALGAQFDLVGEARVGGELAWTGTSTYLARGVRPPEGSEAAAVGAEPRADDAALPPASQTWRLPAGLGRAYAAVSGDINPIHLSPGTARLFGFPRAIAHGMWTHARALAALEGRLPETYHVGVTFTKPVLLPGKVSFTAAESPDGVRFAVLGREDKPHLVGTVTPLAR